MLIKQVPNGMAVITDWLTGSGFGLAWFSYLLSTFVCLVVMVLGIQGASK